MKKSLIALAVAGVFTAPVYAASGNVDVYGKVRMSIDNASISGGNNGGWAMSDRVSRIGFKGTEDLGSGLKAVWQIEQQINATDPAALTMTTVSGAKYSIKQDGAFGGANLRNTFVGLSGDFGTVLIGRHDTPYKLAGSADLFADTIADSQCSGLTAAVPAGSACIIGRANFDQRAKEILAYISPTWSGFSFSVGVMPGEELGLSALPAGGTAAANNDANGLMDAYSLGAGYTNGPLKITAAYENYDGTMVTPAGTAKTQDRSAWKINAGYKIGDLGLGLTYEKSDDGFTALGTAGDKEDNAWLASVSYGMGPITLAAQYGKYEQKDNVGNSSLKNQDLTSWVVGATYALSKRTNVYALYHDNNWGKAPAPVPAGYTVNPDVKHFSVGINHDF